VLRLRLRFRQSGDAHGLIVASVGLRLRPDLGVASLPLVAAFLAGTHAWVFSYGRNLLCV
jgi:hypothetical protein